MSSEGIPDKISKFREQTEDTKDVADAAKEALIHVMKKYSLPADMMNEAGREVLEALGDYQETNHFSRIDALRDVVTHVVDEVLARRSMNTDDIMQEFEVELIDRLPSQTK